MGPKSTNKCRWVRSAFGSLRTHLLGSDPSAFICMSDPTAFILYFGPNCIYLSLFGPICIFSLRTQLHLFVYFGPNCFLPGPVRTHLHFSLINPRILKKAESTDSKVFSESKIQASKFYIPSRNLPSPSPAPGPRDSELRRAHPWMDVSRGAAHPSDPDSAQARCCHMANRAWLRPVISVRVAGLWEHVL